MHLMAFSMKLDKEQARVNRLGVVISNEDKLQFYMEQIYLSNCFNKKEMVDWENKPIAIKDDYNKAKLYFEGLVRDFETYMQNSGGNSAKMGYKSANQMTNVGNKIQKYIQEIASGTAASNKKTAKWAAKVSKEAEAKDDQLKAMTAQIQALTNTLAMLSTAITAAAKENKNPNGSGGGGSGGGGGGGGGSGGHDRGCGGRNRDGRAFHYMHNMGGYCSMHGHHPVCINHTSAMCTRNCDNHNNSTTATNCMGGCMFWPGVTRVRPSQQDHQSYKGKSASN
jgi:hypothetical protein